MTTVTIRYSPLPSGGTGKAELVLAEGTPEERRFPFETRLQIGRAPESGAPPPGVLAVADPTVSSRHCVITRGPDGRYFVRDLSRNGTRLDGRRLVPNVEVEVGVGQVLTVGKGHAFRLLGEPAEVDDPEPDFLPGTLLAPGVTEATVLVGDIRDYTGLMRTASSSRTQQSVVRVFAALEKKVVEYGGTVKEYQGDAVFAFWEGNPDASSAAAACRAALALEREGRRLAADRSVWDVEGFPLHLDWALATGRVIIASLGGDRPLGLSMVGEPVVRAFRLEKFADDATGPILVCGATREQAGTGFRFRDLGERLAPGFEAPEPIYALLGPTDPEAHGEPAP
jgi:adenylate cyclase